MMMNGRTYIWWRRCVEKPDEITMWADWSMQSWHAAREQVELMNGDLCQRPMWRLSGDLTFTSIPESLHGPDQNPSIISRVKSVLTMGKLGEEGDSLRWICLHWHSRNDLQRCWGVDVWSFPAHPERNDSTSNINERLSQRSELLNVVELLVVMTISNQHWNIVTDKEEKIPIDFI